jgi:hypothetical protein
MYTIVVYVMAIATAARYGRGITERRTRSMKIRRENINRYAAIHFRNWRIRSARRREVRATLDRPADRGAAGAFAPGDAADAVDVVPGKAASSSSEESENPPTIARWKLRGSSRSSSYAGTESTENSGRVGAVHYQSRRGRAGWEGKEEEREECDKKKRQRIISNEKKH